jgi:hypothetical protein
LLHCTSYLLQREKVIWTTLIERRALEQDGGDRPRTSALKASVDGEQRRCRNRRKHAGERIRRLSPAGARQRPSETAASATSS